MPDPYLGELKLVAFDFPPRGWALCNGQLLPINQNQALFSLLGTIYGGDGRVTFALPNLQGRVPLHANSGSIALGQSAGEESHTLTFAELPVHNHHQASVNQATSAIPAGRVLAAKPRRGVNVYAPPPATQQINDGPGALVGGNQPHSNMQPFLLLRFIIALQGVFPSHNA